MSEPAGEGGRKEKTMTRHEQRGYYPGVEQIQEQRRHEAASRYFPALREYQVKRQGSEEVEIIQAKNAWEAYRTFFEGHRDEISISQHGEILVKRGEEWLPPFGTILKDESNMW